MLSSPDPYDVFRVKEITRFYIKCLDKIYEIFNFSLETDDSTVLNQERLRVKNYINELRISMKEIKCVAMHGN